MSICELNVDYLSPDWVNLNLLTVLFVGIYGTAYAVQAYYA